MRRHTTATEDATGPTQPFIRLAMVRGRATATGDPRCELGRPPESGGAGVSDHCFAHWRWDGASVAVRTDRLGFHPLFYHAGADGGLSVSPSLLTLLEQGAPADLDETALAVFLRLGFYIGEDTPFRAIRALPPGATLVWRDGRTELSAPAYWRPQASNLSRDAAVDGYIERFRAAVRRLAPEEGSSFAVPLSAGRDSRHILLALVEAGHRPHACLTLRHFPPRMDHDVRVAAQLAAALRLPHVVLGQVQPRFDAELRKNVETHFCSDEHAWYLRLVDHVRGRYSLLYDGIAGDVLSAGLFLTEQRLRLYERGAFRELAGAVCFGDDYYQLPRLLRPEVYARLGREVAVDRLCEELPKHADAPNPVGSFYFWNRTRRETALAAFGLLGRVAEVRTPYLSHDVYEFLAALPAGMLLDHRFHTDAIHRGYAQYASIPFEAEGLLRAGGQSALAGLASTARKLRRDGRHFVPLGLQLARYTLGRPASRLLRTPYLLARALTDPLRPLDDASATLGALGLYLLQLEDVSRRGAGAE